ncbi:MAG: flagellar basal body L-ring protein FlgH [Candidatus Acidiferrales bacterium]
MPATIRPALESSPQSRAKRSRLRATACILALFLAVPAIAFPAHSGKQKQKKPPKPDALDLYLQRARLWGASYVPTTGSLWNPDALMGDLASDDKAVRKGDMITIQLAEATTSALQQSAQTSRAFNASSGVSAFFGNLSATNRAQNLFSPNSLQTLTGKGQTALTTSLTTSLTGNVVEILPNGQMVIEASRMVNVTDQKETLVLRGIIRRSDVNPNNMVSSTSISHLEVEIVGKGVITEGVHPPNKVIRILLRVLGF